MTTSYVNFSASCITSIEYVSGSLYSGNSHNGGDPSISFSGGIWKIAVHGDRSNNSGVAARFNNAIPSANNLWGSNSRSARPNQLNFCFQVIMTFETPSGPFAATLMLGQGRTGLTNDWWIGGDVLCNGGASVGAVEMVCLDRETGALLQVLDLLSTDVENYSVRAWFPSSQSEAGGSGALENVQPSSVDAAELQGTSNNSMSLSGQYIVDVAYIPGTLVCSTTAGNLTISQSGTTWTASLSCERKGSSQVASQFMASVGSSNNMYGAETTSSSPGMLNFFFGLTVTFSFGGVIYSAEVYVGQGHIKSGWHAINNWWIGSSALGRGSDRTLLAFAEPDQAVAQAFQMVAHSAWEFRLLPFWSDFTPVSLPDWMAQLDQTLLITDVNLPGTHDSASIGGYTRLWTTQDSSLTEQFDQGARVFDIRIAVRQESGRYVFYCCHGNFGSSGDVNLFQTLGSALGELQFALGAHPSEFVVMVVNVDDDQGFTDYLVDLNAMFADLPLYDTAVGLPTVAQMVGKIFPLSRKSGLLQSAVALRYHNNPWYVTSVSTADGKYNICVQDKYVGFQGDAEPAKLVIYQDAAINTKSPPRQSGDALLNYGSATDGFKDWFVMGGLNADILAWLGSFPQASRPNRLGWTLHDFFDQSFGTDAYADVTVPQLVVDSNFGYTTYASPFALTADAEVTLQGSGAHRMAQRAAAHAFAAAARDGSVPMVAAVPLNEVGESSVEAFVSTLALLQDRGPGITVREVRFPNSLQSSIVMRPDAPGVSSRQFQLRSDDQLTDRIEVVFGA